MSSYSSDDEDDEVVKEIDIYLAKGLAEKLFLFQYPVRPSNATYDYTSHLDAKIKPVQQKVELELGIDTNSSTYCYPRGEQIAYAVDRDEPSSATQKPLFPSNVMDRQRLSSVKATDDSTKYAAAIYCNNAIHITPIKGIYQLHPNFAYFDKAEENNKKAATASTTSDGDQNEDERDDAKPVQLRFGKNDNQKKKAEVKTVDEKWIQAQFYQPQDRRAIMERNLLFCHQADFESPEFTVTSRDYLKILSPSEKQGAESPADLPHGVLSLLKLKEMNLSDQIKALLITAKVLQFTQLCVLLGGGLDNNSVLTALNQYAMLVQGCWVVKSEILYPESTKSPISGLDANKIWASRDYVMLCFNRKRLLSRKEVASNTRLPTEELREVLEQVAKQRPAQGWEFMLNTDNDFLKAHPEEGSNQLLLWKQKHKEIVEMLNLSEDFSDSDWNEINFPGLFPGIGRKSNSRRRVPTLASFGGEADKPKRKSRGRTKSQSSQDGFISPTEIKDEELSPVPNIASLKQNRLISTHHLDVSDVGTKQKSSKLSHKNRTLSPKKNKTDRSITNVKVSVGKKLNMDSSPTDEKNIKLDNLQVDSNLSVDPVPSDRFESQKIMVRNDSGKMEVHNRHIQVHFNSNPKDKINKVTQQQESIEDENIEVNQKRKRKKKVAAIISDDESEEELSNITSRTPEKETEIYVEDSGKPMNEIEVEDSFNSNDSSFTNDSMEEIFVPPVAAGVRTMNNDTERPPSEIFIKELKKFCREAIQSGCLSFMELKEVLHMRQQEPGNILCTGVSDDLLVQCANDSGAYEVPLKWQNPYIIPIERRRLFLYRYTGDNTDKYRSVLIDMFSESQSLRRKDIFEAFTKTLNEVPSAHTYTKVISEFCQNHHGQWYLNGTYTTLQKYSNS